MPIWTSLSVARRSVTTNIGWYRTQAGHHAAAVTHRRFALAIHREIGDRLGQAATLDSLGYAHRLGDQAKAIAALPSARDLFRESGNRYQEAATAIDVGRACTPGVQKICRPFLASSSSIDVLIDRGGKP
jgi:hypothetical protein